MYTTVHKYLKIGKIPGEVSDVLFRWGSLRNGRVATSWSDFDRLALPASVTPYCAVVDVKFDALDFICRFWTRPGPNCVGGLYRCFRAKY